MQALKFEKDAFATFDQACGLEWIETNGLGGWSGSTVCGANTRRYHGLLVAALHPPVGRDVLVAKCDETVIVGDKGYFLGCYEMDDGTVCDDGLNWLHSFQRGMFPVFEYRLDCGVCLRKTVVAKHEENTVAIFYEVVEGNQSVKMEFEPLFAGRNYHWERRHGEKMPFEYKDHMLRVDLQHEGAFAYVKCHGAHFDNEHYWKTGFKHRLEAYRGLCECEDLYTCGSLDVNLHPHEAIAVVFSDHDISHVNAYELRAHEERRRAKIIAAAPENNPLLRKLYLAADQFIVRRGSGLNTVIAGYPWFTDWGRDTMIALPGLCLSTGAFDTAKKIIHAFAEYISEGMIPNRFPDAGDIPEYNTADASLWFFVAVYRYFEATGDVALIGELYPMMKEMLVWHQRGTRYHIHMEEDGLISAGEAGTQLTWMDAKAGDWVVTPREGKAVEINALWYNALRIAEQFADRFHDEDVLLSLEKLSQKVKKRFVEIFWNEQQGCLYDVIQSDRVDASIRPNQLFALSLPFPLLNIPEGRRVLHVIEEKLVTPVGLRSLAPDDPRYRGHYGGDQYTRDGAYHQGTVWSWLVGPYVDALHYCYGEEMARMKSQIVIDGLTAHLHDGGAVGSISEIFDGDSPWQPRGCFAQAWSVAEFLRIMQRYYT
ncbi:MAG: glycogen debranching protein [Spartobacteria bacterium]|nr:glycogen debranching protein [Spartobacteria bacterium]